MEQKAQVRMLNRKRGCCAHVALQPPAYTVNCFRAARLTCSAPTLGAHHTQLDKVTADAAEFKAGFDKVTAEAVEQKAQLDKAAADAAEYKAGFDKLTVDTMEQKAQVRMSATNRAQLHGCTPTSLHSTHMALQCAAK